MKNKSIFKKVVISLIILIIFISAWFFMGKFYIPSVVLNEGTSLTREQETSIISTTQGYYNKYLPIFTRKITILNSTETSVLYRVDYFPFGHIERSLNKEPDGNWIFNTEKQLSRIS